MKFEIIKYVRNLRTSEKLIMIFYVLVFLWELVFINNLSISEKRGAWEKNLWGLSVVNPNILLSYYGSEAEHSKKSELDKIISVLNKAVKLNTNYGNTYYTRGFTYALEYDFGHALSDFDMAIKINPYHIGAHLARAITYFYKKEYDKSCEDLYLIKFLGVVKLIDPEFRKNLMVKSGRQF